MKPCRDCGKETRVTNLGAFSGEEGAVTVIVDGMPAIVCTMNHKRFLYPELASQLMDLVGEAEKVAPQPPAVKRGVIRKHYHCSECDAELPVSPAKDAEHTLNATCKNATPFNVVVRMGLYRCERCGREQVRSNEELSASACKAIAHGFRAIDIHP